MSALTDATAHEARSIPLVGCSVCDLKPGDCTRPTQCRKKQCDVLGCVQPKDPEYTRGAIVGEWTWCRTHGQLYRNQTAHHRAAAKLLDGAERHGVVL
ncbi:hypothetical protein LCGC14_0274200 [marine sediment metagenome]|uniref:Uncharacterized protein n=2 Tax=root TaxID=1 RepID=A0A9C9NEA2_9HYPH|nr:hypothetical protein [Aurantimonas coralicida]